MEDLGVLGRLAPALFEAPAVLKKTATASRKLAELKGLQRNSAQLLSAESLTRYDSLPVFLGASDHAVVVEELTTLRVLYAAQREQERSQTVKLWIASVEEKSRNTIAFSKQKCLDVLAQFERHPPDLRSIELEKVAGLRALVVRRLDELDISDLIERVAEMPESKRKLLLQQLNNLYQEERT